MKRYFISLLTIIALFSTINYVQAQSSLSGANVVTSAVPFLTISPDSRAGGMGDIGVATSPDLFSQHWNAAKYAFLESDMGVATGYSPWLRKLIDDINIAYLVGYKRIDEVQGVSASLRYFALGDITFRNQEGEYIAQHNPNEFAIDLGYNRQLSDYLSGAVTVRYIRSDITGGQYSESSGETNAGDSFAADVAFYYRQELQMSRRDNIFQAGINIQNIGNKMSYDGGQSKYFIPTNLKLGFGYTSEMDDYNTFSFSVELNKLLVPTPQKDTTAYNPGDIVIPGGGSSDKSVVAAMFSSFGDAPNGLKEELQEINIAAGVEYWYNQQFAIRAGYFYEHENKGNRKYFTAGAGLRFNVFALDFSYLLPTQRNHPLENTLRFSLSFDIDAFSNQR